jgi:hypothetical protein
MAGGLLEFLADGSWTKRLHPGWAAMCGLTAASFAGVGWSGPPAVYEGRFGLYNTHLGGRETNPAAVGDGLGQTWELMRTAVKPYPICHFIHAFADAVLDLRAEHGLRPEDIAAIRCAIHPVPGKVVCQPAEAKWAPRDEYDAKFSLPFVVSAALSRGRFTLAELAGGARRPGDPGAGPQGRGARRPGQRLPPRLLRRGRDRAARRAGAGAARAGQPGARGPAALSNADIVAKFEQSMARVADGPAARRVLESVLALGDDRPAAGFAESCRA